MALVRKVDSEQSLQNLITHTIFTQKDEFSVRDITEKVQESEMFNEFCSKAKVMEMVATTITDLLRADAVVQLCHGGKYFPLNTHI